MQDSRNGGSSDNAQKPAKPVSRREARRAAMEVIFSALTNNAAAADSIAGVRAVQPAQDAPRRAAALDDALTQTIISVFDDQRTAIETCISEHSQRPLATMTMMERTLLTAALAEMRGCPATPVKVIINEAIELAKTFGVAGGSRLVNAVLDAAAAPRR